MYMVQFYWNYKRYEKWNESFFVMEFWKSSTFGEVIGMPELICKMG